MRATPDNDPEVKEKCFLCDGKGKVMSLPMISDGSDWMITGPEFEAVCPKCKGSGRLTADYIYEEELGSEPATRTVPIPNRGL